MLIGLDTDTKFDFIIVGAGSAGSVLGNRLTENHAWKVLIIEAGGEEVELFHDIPALCHSLQRTSVDWQYKTEPSDKFCTAMNNNQCNWPRGKVMGGSSSINYMIYNRGHRKDYDNWAAMGNTGWNYSNVQPYFKKIESTQVKKVPIDTKYRGKDGPVYITDQFDSSEMGRCFVQGAKELGFQNIDYNNGNEVAVAKLQSNQKKGLRQSSNTAYIKPILNRPNLKVINSALVTKLVIDSKTKTVSGVTFEKFETTYTVMAKKEVIVSAGAVNSPQLLMLSGIGPAAHLKSVGITPIVDLPVGKNLQDHVSLAIITIHSTADAANLLDFGLESVATLPDYIAKGKGPLSVPGFCEGILFTDTLHPNDKKGHCDLEILMLTGILTAYPGLPQNFGFRKHIIDAMYGKIKHKRHFTMAPIVLRPKSRGEIKLKSKNPNKHPAIYPNYYKNTDDLDTIVRGVRIIQKIVATKGMQKIKAVMVNKTLPGCEDFAYDSDAYWKCHAKAVSATMYHPAGTCKMGPKGDKTAVVDHRLKVHKIKKLRVVDTSVMPNIVAG